MPIIDELGDSRRADAGVEPAGRPMVTVIMPVRNEESFVARSLAAALDQDYPADRMEVLVVDGASDDATPAVASAMLDQRRAAGIETCPVRIITNPEKIVPSSLNLGLSAARGEVIIRVDGHCEVAGDYVRQCVEALDRHGASCVGGPMTTVGQGTVGAAIALAQSCRFGVGGAAFRTGTARPRPVDTLAFGAYRKGAFEEIGGFDEELVRNQDDEFNLRLTRAGGRIWLDPAIRSIYHSRASLRSLWRQYWQYGYYKVRVIQKHGEVATSRQLVPPLFVLGLSGSLVVSLLKRSPVAIVTVTGTYAATNIGASVLETRRDLRLAPFVSAAFGAMHLSYGSGFLSGLWRWRVGAGTGTDPLRLGSYPPDR